jgi:uncharacterized repeat protein (TIGR03803 family)
MTSKSLARLATAAQAFAIALAFLLKAPVARAGETVILRFNKTQGSEPLSGLTADSLGNLYGTTSAGGAANCGTALELSPVSGGKWTETVLYSFQGCRFPGASAFGTMVFDKQGNLYGTLYGKSKTFGSIFELSKGADATWSEKTIYQFGLSEGDPNGDLTWDNAGNLYGTTTNASATLQGEVFELSPQPDGSWKEAVLYAFPAPNGVGIPAAGVVFDGKGNLYGATFLGIGGIDSYGAVYELSPQDKLPWALTVIQNFTFPGPNGPNSRLTFDSSGNLYGTTSQLNYGPPSAFGEIFKLTPGAGGQWTETTIHSFRSGSDGSSPHGALVFDPSGNLYGTTSIGGLGCNGSLCGTVYKLAPQSDGTWKEATLHQFESAEDGSQPQQGLLLDGSGNLYGTTSFGGSRHGYGTVFKIVP